MSVSPPDRSVDDDPPCAEVVELFTDYLDQALSPRDRARLDAHLADCDGCTVVLEQFRTTIVATGRLGVDDIDRLDDTARAALLDVFRRWTADRSR